MIDPTNTSIDASVNSSMNTVKKQCSICCEGHLVALGTIKSPYISKGYTLYQCQSCQSRSFDVDEHREVDLSAHYEARSTEEAYLKSSFTVSRYWRDEVNFISNLFGGLPQTILDVGCRTGDFLLHWPREVNRVGVEVSSHSVAVALERGLDIRQGFLEDIEFATGFDVVTGYAILEHLADPQRFLSRVTQLVNKQGILVIMIPSYQTFKARLLEATHIRWHMYSPPEHLCLYSREFLDGYLQARGFTLLRRRYTSGGMFNPFRRIPLARRLFSRTMYSVDTQSPVNRFPIFDHMYSYYKYSH